MQIESNNRLRVSEIFFSLQGESVTVGLPTVFVRLTGCPLRCHYCDTEYAFHGGRWMEFESILAEISQYQTQWICVTGGEPLAQKASIALLQNLCDADFQVSLETSGAMDLSQVDRRVSKVMDLKTPGSGESGRNRMENLQYLTPKDQLKFVICHRSDYDWATQLLRQQSLQNYCEVLFSPAYGALEASQLAQWILDDQLPVRFQLQLHKILWGEEQGR